MGGSYLSKPVTEKVSSSGSGLGHRWACSSMQGWRKQMEDAHVVRGSLGGRGSTCGLLSLFGVFDGHGGSEVARFCSKPYAMISLSFNVTESYLYKYIYIYIIIYIYVYQYINRICIYEYMYAYKNICMYIKRMYMNI